MSLVLALVLQAQAPGSSPPLPLRIDFDLASYRSADFETGVGARHCDRDRDPAAITVCARRSGGNYPLARMTRRYGPQRIAADIAIAGNLRGGIHTQRVNLDPAATDSSLPHDISDRITIGLRLPF